MLNGWYRLHICALQAMLQGRLPCFLQVGKSEAGISRTGGGKSPKLQCSTAYERAVIFAKYLI